MNVQITLVTALHRSLKVALLATMQPPTLACKDDINVCLTLAANGIALMGAMRKVLARKVLNIKYWVKSWS